MACLQHSEKSHAGISAHEDNVVVDNESSLRWWRKQCACSSGYPQRLGLTTRDSVASMEQVEPVTPKRGPANGRVNSTISPIANEGPKVNSMRPYATLSNTGPVNLLAVKTSHKRSQSNKSPGSHYILTTASKRNIVDHLEREIEKELAVSVCAPYWQ